MQLQARRRAEASITNRPSSSRSPSPQPEGASPVRAGGKRGPGAPSDVPRACRRQGARRDSGPPGKKARPGPSRDRGRRLAERPPRAEPWSGGSPDAIPNSEVKPRLAESTATPGRGRIGRSARGGRFARHGGARPGICPGRAPRAFPGARAQGRAVPPAARLLDGSCCHSSARRLGYRPTGRFSCLRERLL